MHDPMTVAHEIRFFGRSIFTIWHVDPETDGTDNSCGWFNPKLTDREEKIIEKMVDWDMDMPYFSTPDLPRTVVDPNYNYSQMWAGDCLSFVAWVWVEIAWSRDRRRKLTIDEWWNVVNLSSNPHDNLREILADPDEEAKDRVERFFYCVLKAYLRHHRPWWKHPRWHIRHWKIQFHFWQTLRRWLFSRCADCGRRFRWGYSPISSGGNRSRRKWFESEKNCYHHDCYTEAERIQREDVELDSPHSLSGASGHPED